MLVIKTHDYNHRFNKTDFSIKKRIVLMNSYLPITTYFGKLNMGDFDFYKKIPNYTIDKKGNIFHHVDDNYKTNIFNNVEDSEVIFVCLENLGWLDYDSINDVYINYMNFKVLDNPHTLLWKNKKYWDKYTFIQVNKLYELLTHLCDKHGINKKFIGHNTYVDDLVDFNGILCRSNYNDLYYDISPAMDFEEMYLKFK